MPILGLAESVIDVSSATTAVENGLTSVGASMNGMITSVVPIALGIIGAVLVVTFGVKIFKKLTGKA